MGADFVVAFYLAAIAGMEHLLKWHEGFSRLVWPRVVRESEVCTVFEKMRPQFYESVLVYLFSSYQGNG